MKPAISMTVFAAAIASVLITAQARADVAPPPGYVEQCTVDKQAVNGRSCVACPANHSDMKVCENQYSPEGYAKACQSYGASVWTEVWCRGGSDAGVTPPDNLPGGCSCRTAAPNAGSLGALVAVVGAALLMRRRR